MLAAEPHFLGLLREKLDLQTKNAVLHEIPHEYKRGSEGEIRSLVLKAIESGK